MAIEVIERNEEGYSILPINSHVIFTNEQQQTQQTQELPQIQEEINNNNKNNNQNLFSSSSLFSLLFSSFYFYFLNKFKPFFIKNFLVLSFFFILIFSLSFPLPGQIISSYKLKDVGILQALNSFFVFFISGISLNIKDTKNALKDWNSLVFGIITILFITPLFGYIYINIPLNPSEFSNGIALFCIVPTTLGVGVALTIASNGNQSLALLLTLSTNCLGIITSPLMLKLILSDNSSIHFDYFTVFIKLLFTILVPSIIGISLRASSDKIRQFVQLHRTELSLFSTTNLVCIIWQTLSSSASILLKQNIISIIYIILLLASNHLIMLGLIYLVSKYVFKYKLQIIITLTIMLAQKSAPVAITLISYITSDSKQAGLLSVPCLIGQLLQIFIGSFLIQFFQKLVKKEENENDNNNDHNNNMNIDNNNNNNNNNQIAIITNDNVNDEGDIEMEEKGN